MNKSDFLKADTKDLREKLEQLKRQQAEMDDPAAKARAEGEIRSVQLSLEKAEAEQAGSGEKK
ncbi:MAG: hypothetical protein ACR2JE_06140 [Acidobacteriaceae bacterium]